MSEAMLEQLLELIDAKIDERQCELMGGDSIVECNRFFALKEDFIKQHIRGEVIDCDG